MEDRQLEPAETDEITDEIHTALPPRMESWRRRSAAGAILTGISLGLREALETRPDEPGIVAQVSGEPPGELPVECHLDGVRTAGSVVTIRPWLLDGLAHHPLAHHPLAEHHPPGAEPGP